MYNYKYIYNNANFRMKHFYSNIRIRITAFREYYQLPGIYIDHVNTGRLVRSSIFILRLLLYETRNARDTMCPLRYGRK